MRLCFHAKILILVAVVHHARESRATYLISNLGSASKSDLRIMTIAQKKLIE